MKLGKLHRYWLGEVLKSGGMLSITGYSNTPHGSAIQGLINRELLQLESVSDGPIFNEKIWRLKLTTLGHSMVAA